MNVIVTDNNFPVWSSPVDTQEEANAFMSKLIKYYHPEAEEEEVGEAIASGFWVNPNNVKTAVTVVEFDHVDNFDFNAEIEEEEEEVEISFSFTERVDIRTRAKLDVPTSIAQDIESTEDYIREHYELYGDPLEEERLHTDTIETMIDINIE